MHVLHVFRSRIPSLKFLFLAMSGQLSGLRSQLSFASVHMHDMVVFCGTHSFKKDVTRPFNSILPKSLIVVSYCSKQMCLRPITKWKRFVWIRALADNIQTNSSSSTKYTVQHPSRPKFLATIRLLHSLRFPEHSQVGTCNLECPPKLQ